METGELILATLEMLKELIPDAGSRALVMIALEDQMQAVPLECMQILKMTLLGLEDLQPV